MRETVYKLTDADMLTRNKTQWVLGEERTAPGGGPLCSDRWLHAYADPLIAELMDSVHGNFGAGKRLFRCEGIVGAREPLKLGCTSLTLIEELPVPEITLRQRVTWAILCIRAIPGRQPIPEWEAWADAYLAGDVGAVARAAVWAAAREAWADACLAGDAGAQARAARAAAAVRAAAVSSPEIDFAGLAHKAMEARYE